MSDRRSPFENCPKCGGGGSATFSHPCTCPPEPPMTRCPKCGEEWSGSPDAQHQCPPKPRRRDGGPTPPAPHDAPLDFEKRWGEAMERFYADGILPDSVRAFVAALVEKAVAENDRMWGLSIIPLGADHIHAVTTRFIALREARDDHR